MANNGQSGSDTSRRNVIKMAGGVSAAASIGGLAGCTGSEGEKSNSNTDGAADNEAKDTAASEAKDKEIQQDQINYWGISTTFPSSWKPFTDKSGVKINGSTAPWRQGKVINKMVKGSAATDYDVVNMDVTITRPVAQQGAIENMDVESLSRWKDAYPEVKNSGPTALSKSKEQLPDEDQWAVNMVQNGDSVGYLPKHVGDPSKINSYGVLFDKEFKNRTALEAGWATEYPKIAQYLKYNNMADISKEDIQFVTKDSMKTVFDFLMEQKKEGQFRTFWSGWESAVNLLASEEVWAMGTWEPVVFALRNDKGMEAEYLDPKEGYSLWGESPWMTKGAAQKGKRKTVRNFVNWMMGGYYGAEMIKLRGYLPPTPKGIDYAKNNDGYDADFQKKRHDEVRRRLSMDKSTYGYNFPSPEVFQYCTSRWQRLSG